MGKSLVFVIGAGASKEADLPLGYELAAKIESVMKEIVNSPRGNRSRVEESIRQLCSTASSAKEDLNAHLEACRLIRDGMAQAPSIDTFIDVHAANPLVASCGKLAIAHCLLKAEERSPMYVDRSNSRNTLAIERLSGTWYAAFFDILLSRTRPDRLADQLSRIGIITFNYDRCIEHYLHASLQRYHSVSASEAADLLRKLRIVHVYGWLGALPWAGGESTIEFGAEADAHALPGVADQIRTFTEAVDDSRSEVVEIREMLSTAERIAFLGFAFNPQNVSLLFGVPGTMAPRALERMLSTGQGLSDSDIKTIRGRLASITGISPPVSSFRQGLKCAELLAQHGNELTLCLP